MSRSLLAVTVGLSLVLGAACSEKKSAPVSTPTEPAAPVTPVAAVTPDAAAPAAADPARDPEALKAAAVQVEGLKKMCADSADARAKRQKEKLLYTRLGGHDALVAVVTDIIELHDNDPITKPVMKGVDKPKLIKLVVEFLGKAAGGPEKYTGRDMVAAHAHLNMTDVHFMTAGGHIGQILAKYKVPEPEQQEVLCLIVSHHADAIR